MPQKAGTQNCKKKKNSQLLMLLWRISRCNMLAKFLEISTISATCSINPQLLLTKALLCGSINQTLSASDFLNTTVSDENVWNWLAGNSERSAGLKYFWLGSVININARLHSQSWVLSSISILCPPGHYLGMPASKDLVLSSQNGNEEGVCTWDKWGHWSL